VSTFPSRERFEGYFVKGLKEGKGVYIDPNKGVKYEGEWRAGVKHGYGVITWTNKTKEVSYEGEFKRDLIDGVGTMKYNDGDKCKGIWVNGVLQEVLEWILSDMKQRLRSRLNGVKAFDVQFEFFE
jgi:hypothetical protein